MRATDGDRVFVADLLSERAGWAKRRWCGSAGIHVSDLAEAHVGALQALFAGNRSEVYNLGNGRGFSVKEVINSVASLQIVNQGLKRYTSSDEHRRAAKNFGIGMYDGVHRAQSYPAAPSASKQPRHFLTILIPSARQIDHDDLIFPQCRSQFRRLRKGMGGFQSR